MKGIFISFLGRDGSGKTAIINRVVELAERNSAVVKRYHLFTNTLLPVRHGEDTSKPHNKKARGPVRSFFKLAAFSLEYLAGYYIKIAPAKRKQNLVIFDRYYYDLIADPVRYKHGLASSWTKWFMKVVPKPDFTFIIDVPSEEIMKRKSELSFDELQSLRTKYLALPAMLADCYIICNTGTIEEAATEVFDVVQQKM